MHIEDISPEDIVSLEIQTGSPCSTSSRVEESVEPVEWYLGRGGPAPVDPHQTNAQCYACNREGISPADGGNELISEKTLWILPSLRVLRTSCC